MQFQTTDNINIHYEVSGSGHPILCLPGLTRNASDFEEFLAAFQDKAQIIRMTNRGRQPSDYDKNFHNYNVLREGNDAIELLDHLGIEKALWLGTSRGGMMTMASAPRHIDRMKGAVLNDIGPELNLDGLYRIIGYLGIQPEFTSLDQAARVMQADQGDRFPDLGFQDWRKLAARYYDFRSGISRLRYDAKLREAVLESEVSVDLWQGFQSLKSIPLGLVWGENSDLLTENEVLKMRENNPAMKVARVPNRGHVPFLDEPQSIALITEIFELSFH